MIKRALVIAFNGTFTALCHGGTVDAASKNPVVAVPPEDSGVTPFFVGLDAGGFWMHDFTVGNPLGVNFKFKSGTSLEVPLGYDFGNGFSVSLSAGWDHAADHLLTGESGGERQTASTQGSFTFVPLLANAAYSVKIVGKLSWDVEGGIGAAHETASFKSFDIPAYKSITFGKLGAQTAVFDGISNTDWAFAFQASTGLSYELCRYASVNLGYRYLFLNEQVSVNGSSSSSLRGQTAEIGVRWRF